MPCMRTETFGARLNSALHLSEVLALTWDFPDHSYVMKHEVWISHNTASISFFLHLHVPEQIWML